MQFVRPAAVLMLGLLIGDCSGISIFDGPERNHISLANRYDYNVSVAADGRKLLVSLDTKSALGQRLVWAGSCGTADGPPSSDFDTAASDWLKFEKPECKAANGRRTGFGSFEYNLTCGPLQAGDKSGALDGLQAGVRHRLGKWFVGGSDIG
jgi:hypothetical protein